MVLFGLFLVIIVFDAQSIFHNKKIRTEFLIKYIFLIVLSNRKAVQNRNWTMVVISVLMEIYAMMEQVYYYPLFIMGLIYLFARIDNKDLELQGEVQIIQNT